ncbi:MAG: hypothetical protein IT479_15615 [Xanthomonadales bacterium]|nr:hypothetical protein [Xanthomonadales bacterium]MCC6594690.1 hypothetical protein [Xanthomonadales bacterium]
MSRRPVAACLFLLCLVPGLPQAQSSGGGYEMRKHALAGGGGQASGGSYRLVTTTGQSDASVASGGSYRLVGGFHQPTVVAPPPTLFADGFE